MAVRTCTVQYMTDMRDIGHFLEGRHVVSTTQSEGGIESYIRSTRMNYDSVLGYRCRDPNVCTSYKNSCVHIPWGYKKMAQVWS